VFKPLTHRAVTQEIREQIWSLIFQGRLQPGSKLPAEKDLLKQFRVSRPALREALHELIGEGILEMRHGQGTFVRELTAGSAIQGGAVSLLLLPGSIKEIQEARLVLEPALAMWAAERSTEGQLRELGSFLSDCAAEDPVTFAAGWEFHRRLAAVAGNSAMTKIAHVLFGMVQEYQRHFYDVHFDPEHDLGDHIDLLKVILLRDPAQARAAMEAHIRAGDSFLEGALSGEQSMRASGST
jgi:GntR family transcriptional regulator, transcriptional repressor for pyruvate dehydrogenase complex